MNYLKFLALTALITVFIVTTFNGMLKYSDMNKDVLKMGKDITDMRVSYWKLLADQKALSERMDAEEKLIQQIITDCNREIGSLTTAINGKKDKK